MCLNQHYPTPAEENMERRALGTAGLVKQHCQQNENGAHGQKLRNNAKRFLFPGPGTTSQYYIQISYNNLVSAVIFFKFSVLGQFQLYSADSTLIRLKSATYASLTTLLFWGMQWVGCKCIWLHILSHRVGGQGSKIRTKGYAYRHTESTTKLV